MAGCAGLKLQVTPTGKPAQLSLTVPARPDRETSCKVTGEEVDPDTTFKLFADRVSVMSGVPADIPFEEAWINIAFFAGTPCGPVVSIAALADSFSVVAAAVLATPTEK
jgi:hypothetical protein